MKKGNFKIINVGDTILAAAVENGINENLCLLDNQSTCNAFINRIYLSNIRESSDRKYLCFYCNAGVTQTNKIGDLPVYSDPVVGHRVIFMDPSQGK